MSHKEEGMGEEIHYIIPVLHIRINEIKFETVCGAGANLISVTKEEDLTSCNRCRELLKLKPRVA